MPEEELARLHNILINYTDCGKAGILTGIQASEDEIKRYADALYECSVRLLEQNPDIVVLPIRGGAVFGLDVDDIAACIRLAQGKPYFTYRLTLHASGISRDKRVAKQVEDELRMKYKMSEFYPATDEEGRKAYALPRLRHLTIIDTAYTECLTPSYSQYLSVFYHMPK
jgi:hypothetical protein